MEIFGILGFTAFMMWIFHMDQPEKVKKLEREFKKFKRSMKGEKKMSKLIQDLKGQKCLIKGKASLFTEGASFGMVPSSMECDVVDIDDEWIRIVFESKKDGVINKIIRIDDIESINTID